MLDLSVQIKLSYRISYRINICLFFVCDLLLLTSRNRDTLA